ncbi:MAG: NAD-dependent epimerase/dehydratase family protein [Burkholderiaceae bacterium]
MRVFVTGASGYIGGSVCARLISDGHEVLGLARSGDRAAQIRELGIEPVVGTLDDAPVLARATRACDAVINAAHADHLGAVNAILSAISGSGKCFIHTSGTSIVGKRDRGEQVDDVFDEQTDFTPSPARAARVALNEVVLEGGANNLRSIVIAPSLIYGKGRGLHQDSMQVPWLIALARQNGRAKHIGSGQNIWSNVHIDDLVDLYMLALNDAPTRAFYFAENGENSMLSICQAINRMIGQSGDTEVMTVEQAAAIWGEGPANDTMGSNSRVRAVRAREELGWKPNGPSLIQEIESGYYSN